MRQCGDCQLCCVLLPVRSPGLLDKDGGVKCKHQKFKKGCTVYNTRQMPPCCAFWNCRWLVSDDTQELPRPDRSHYVIDIMPDYVTAVDNDTGKKQPWQVVQIWVDPKHRDAHRDPLLREYILRRAHERIAAIVRFDQQEALIIFAPPISSDGLWHEIVSATSEPTHSLADVIGTLGGDARVVLQ